jgi:predicted nucleic acid-binding Zn ribbon protein
MRTKHTVRIGDMLAKMLGGRKWQGPLRAAEIRARWPEIVGPEIAERARPIRLTRGKLLVHCDHDVWRTELHYLEPEILERIAQVMGEGVVKEIFLK